MSNIKRLFTFILLIQAVNTGSASDSYLIQTAIANGGIGAILFLMWWLTFKHLQKQFEFALKQNQEQFDKALKQMDFDSILKDVKEYILDNKAEKLKIEIKKDDKKLSLIINDTNLASIDFLHNMLNEDIYFLENTIHELVEDFYSNGIFKSDIIICV